MVPGVEQRVGWWRLRQALAELPCGRPDQRPQLRDRRAAADSVSRPADAQGRHRLPLPDEHGGGDTRRAVKPAAHVDRVPPPSDGVEPIPERRLVDRRERRPSVESCVHDGLDDGGMVSQERKADGRCMGRHASPHDVIDVAGPDPGLVVD